MVTTNESDNFLSESIFMVQNFKYVQFNTNLSSVRVRMIDYSPVGDSVFLIDGKEVVRNFTKWILDCKFTEVKSI